jgi:hypothetical protein
MRIRGRPRWIKSSLSTYNGDCVEVAGLAGETISVRDSKDPRGAVLSFSAAEWDAFIGGVRDGEFDRRPRSRRKFPHHRPDPSSRAQIGWEVNETSERHKRRSTEWPAWMKAAAVTVAAAASLATAATQGNHDSGVITDGPPSCVIYTVK